MDGDGVLALWEGEGEGEVDGGSRGDGDLLFLAVVELVGDPVYADVVLGGALDGEGVLVDGGAILGGGDGDAGLDGVLAAACQEEGAE